MNKEEIIRMAEKAEMPKWLQEDWFANPFDSFVLRFAYLIAAAEREECAKLCENYLFENVDERFVSLNCAALVRARGSNV